MDKLNKNYWKWCFLNFSKAFDTVDHSIISNKLHHYGIRGSALDWFRSYLSNRQQFVAYNNVSSGNKELKCGVPQPSVLGPFLFLIGINDLANISKHTILFFFFFFFDLWPLSWPEVPCRAASMWALFLPYPGHLRYLLWTTIMYKVFKITEVDLIWCDIPWTMKYYNFSGCSAPCLDDHKLADHWPDSLIPSPW